MVMNAFEITSLDGDISKHPGLSNEVVTRANKVIKSTKSYLVKCPYGTVIWDNKSLVKQLISYQDKDKNIDLTNIKNPIGLVLSGVLEVTELFVADNVTRRRVTKLLRPGDFFGLFEAYANLYGFWRITSGLTRILITNRIGDKRILEELGLNSDQSLKDALMFKRDAAYDYSIMLEDAFEKESDKNRMNLVTSFILFDGNAVKNDLKHELKDNTIAQLTSLVRQNSYESFLNPYAYTGSAVKHKDPLTNETIATFDAILRGHIPVFRLTSSNDSALLPYTGIVHILGFTNDDVKNRLPDDLRTILDSTPHVFIPDTVDANNDGCIYMYAQPLSHKIRNFEVFDSIITALKGKNQDHLRYLTVEDKEPAGRNSYSAVVTLPENSDIADNKRLTFTIFRTDRVDSRVILPKWFTDVLFGNGNKYEYEWPAHFHELILIKPIRT